MIEEKLKALDVNPRSPLSVKEIEQIEAKIGEDLPDAYRRMLVTYGGLSFNDVFYHDPKVGQPTRFGWFFDYSELVDAVKSYAEAIPENMIPVGEDGGGNLYCLGIAGGDRNKVFFHDHCIGWQADAEKYIERGEPVPAGLRYQTVYLIGESFESFILGLFSQD